MPSPLTARPPRQALEWALGALDALGPDCPGGRVTAVRVLSGGRSHANHALTVIGPAGRRTVVLRRWARPGWVETDAEFTVAREVAALTALAAADLPTPRVLAADPEGTAADVPALLLTRLPGRPPDPARGAPPDLAGALARALLPLHDLDPGGVPAYRPYNERLDLPPPAASMRPELWRTATRLLAGPVPTAPDRFLHRDYHPGNTLWSRDRLTGIVDWPSASRGPAGVDVAHMHWNLAVSWGSAMAAEFRGRYEAAAGTGRHDPYWDLRTVVDLLPHDPGWPFVEPELSRLEAHLEAAVRAAG